MTDPIACPEECPNRFKNKHPRLGRYLFSLLCAALLSYFCYSAERRGEEVPVAVWMPLLILVGTGFEVDFAAIACLLQRNP